MKTLIRLLLQDQSDLRLHCLPRPIVHRTLGHYGNHKEVKQTDRGRGFTKPIVLSTFQTMRYAPFCSVVTDTLIPPLHENNLVSAMT